MPIKYGLKRYHQFETLSLTDRSELEVIDKGRTPLPVLVPERVFELEADPVGKITDASEVAPSEQRMVTHVFYFKSDAVGASSWRVFCQDG